jgi:hypothetical protein
MAYLRLGGLAVQLNRPYEEKVRWYQQANSYLPLRVEPYNRLAEHYLFIEVDRAKVRHPPPKKKKKKKREREKNCQVTHLLHLCTGVRIQQAGRGAGPDQQHPVCQQRRL